MSFETSFIPSELLWNQQSDVANVYLLEAIITPLAFSRQPVIRRRVLVPRSYSLLQLHVVLVVVFGWQNRHQHEFVPAALEPTKPAGLFGLGPDNGRRLTNRPFSFLESLKPRGGDSEDQPSYQVLDESDESGSWFKECGPGISIEHSHPHEGSTTGSNEASSSTFFIWHHFRDERFYTVEDLFTSESAKIRYRYDFGSGPEVTLILVQMATAQPNVFDRLPIYIGGETPSPTEDDYAELQPSLEPNYVTQNRLNQHHHPPSSVEQCYMCYWYRPACRKRTTCAPGQAEACCAYCLHAPRAWDGQDKLPEEEAKTRYEEAKAELRRHRRMWVEDGKCEWVEVDGEPCRVCKRRKVGEEKGKAGDGGKSGGGNWLPEALF